MSADFAELDYRQTPLGELTLRRRRVRALDGLEVYEVKLGDAFLMSSLFHEVEVALADLGLAALYASELDVVVGGLGLGYTARAALRQPNVRALLVVEALAAVIAWHERGLVPLGAELTADRRCRLVPGDFFALAADPQLGFDPACPGGSSTRSCWISITRRATSCTRGTVRFTLPRACAAWPRNCIPRGSSRYGPTIRLTRRSWRRCGRSSPPPTRRSLPFSIPCSNTIAPAPSM